jgi:hypothetical protein
MKRSSQLGVLGHRPVSVSPRKSANVPAKRPGWFHHRWWGAVAVWFALVSTTLAGGNRWTVSAGADWKAVNLADLEVRCGSALDFSTLFPHEEAGKYGFVIVNKNGAFAFEKKPEEPLRFLCHSGLGDKLGIATPAEIENYADQVARGGYNMVRPHYLDLMLNGWASTQDAPLVPDMLDHWDRLASALKKRGIYLFLDVTTTKPELKIPLYCDAAARQRWKAGVAALLTHVNPYTGLALRDDPLVAMGQLVNESELNYLMARKEPDKSLVVPFRQWLRQKYVTTEALKAAWTTKDGKPLTALGENRTIDTVDLPSALATAKGPDAADLQLFFIDIQRQSFQWMAQTVRELGLRIPLTEYNISYSFESDLTRDVLPFIDNHTYYDHPRLINGRPLGGTTILAGNPLGHAGALHPGFFSTKQLGRPFTCSEWGHVFWNPYRYQAGLTLPVYAAFQGVQMIAQFTDPIRPPHLRRPLAEMPIEPFRLFKDPPLKAGEYMSALLFRRGDVKPSPHCIEMVVDAKTTPKRVLLQDSAPSALTQMSLLFGFGVRVPDWAGAAPRGAYHADLSVPVEDAQAIVTQEGAQSVVTSTDGFVALQTRVRKLRKAGLLSAGNRTDIVKGIYESDTDEILYRKPEGTVQVATPMSEGGTLFPGKGGLKLPNLNVTVEGADGAVFAGSLAKEPLAKSPHILLLIATDALNSGMAFNDSTRKTLVDLGKGTVLMRVVRANLSLRNTAPGTPHLWALAPSGERVEEIPLTVKDGIISASIDTAALRNGPTPYFEMVRTGQ